VESLLSDIFSPFVFNNIVEHPFIFSPPVFWLLGHRDFNNLFNFNDMHFQEVLLVGS